MRFSLPFLVAVLFCAIGLVPVHGQVAVHGELVYTMNGDPIENGVVLVQNGEIQEVGSAGEISIPEHYEEVRGEVVTPGLIDARSTVGLSGIFNVEHDQDQLETSSPIQPELRAIDAYNPREELVEYLRGFGVTTVHTGHGPGALMSGQTMIAKTSGHTLQEVVVDSSAMISMTLGPSVTNRFETPGTRAKSVSMLRETFMEGQQYLNQEDPTPNLQLDYVAQMLEGETPALIVAHRATEIQAALRLAEEFDLDLVLEGASEVYTMLDEVRNAGVAVFVHPTMVRAGGETEHVAFDTPARLRDAGIPFSFTSSYEAYVPKTRVILFEAGVAAKHGLDTNDALSAITIDAAELLGIDDDLGSLEPGKDADIAVFNGDPFEYMSQVCTVLINGEIVSDECH